MDTHLFAFEISGIPALLLVIIIVAVPLYLFLYLPFKLVMIVVAHASQKAERLRRLQQQTIVAEYDPPGGLTPAEIGFLFDSKLSLAEIFGTVAYLEQQGLILITEQPDGLLITAGKTVPSNLKKFERYVLDTINEQSGRPLTLKLMKKMRPLAEQVLKKQLQEQGYLLAITEQMKRSFDRLLIIVILLVLLFPVATFQVHTLEGITLTGLFFFFAWPLYFIFAFRLYATYKKIAGEPWLGTPKLKEIWSDIEGYRHFIEVVEADNLKFDTETTKGIIKDKTLPYAIALGFNTGWRQKFTPLQS